MLWAVFIAVVLMLACRPVRKVLMWLIIIAVVGWEFALVVLGIGVAVGLAWEILQAREERLLA